MGKTEQDDGKLSHVFGHERPCLTLRKKAEFQF